MTNKHPSSIGVWFPTIRTGTGTDVFTISLSTALKEYGVKSEITWFPHRTEYLPWIFAAHKRPSWATVIHTNPVISGHFIGKELPIITTFHGCVHDPVYNKYKTLSQKIYHRLWVRRLQQKSIKNATVITAVSKHTAEQVSRIFRMKNVTVIYNWVDTKKFVPIERKEPNRPFKLLFVGKPTKRKGADLLPAIMDKLGPDFQLHFTGTINDLKQFGQLPGNILSLGKIENEVELISLYQQADALLFPSRLEGMSLVTLEAQSCGLPIIGTNVSSMPEVVKNGTTGILCDIDDTKSICKAAQILYHNPEMLRYMRVESRNNIVSNFNKNESIESYIKLYNNCIN